MKRNLSLKVFKEIKKRILNLTLSPGVKISDEEIARELRISRTPVREAVNRLAAEGFVEARPNRGFSVRVFDKKEVKDTYVLRESLETLAARLTTNQINDSQRRSIQELLDTYPLLIESQNLMAFNDADERFHELIAIYSDNSALMETLKNLQGKIRMIRRFDHLRPTSFAGAYQEHLKIFNAISDGNVEKAVKQMSSHILTSMKVVMNVLNR